MKPEIAQNRISAALFVTLITLGSAGAIADFQGIDNMPGPYNTNSLTDNTSSQPDHSIQGDANVQEVGNLSVSSRLLESSYKGDALLYTLGLDFLANNYLAVRNKFERWLSIDSPVMSMPMQSGSTEPHAVNSGLRFVF